MRTLQNYFLFSSSRYEFPCPESPGMSRTLEDHLGQALCVSWPQFQLPESHFLLPAAQVFSGGSCKDTPAHTHAHARAPWAFRLCAPRPRAPRLQADLLEEVPLASGREGHLPARGQRQLVGYVVGLLAEVRVLLRGGARGARAGAQLQGRGRRVRADVLGAARQPGPRVAAGRVGARLARVRAGVGLLEERLGQDLLPPRAGLRVHDRVEESFEVRVEVLRDVDDLLPGRRERRERRGRRGRIHLLQGERSGQPLI